MSNIHPSLAPGAEKIKALQYIFDVSRQSPAPAAVHDQAKIYAQFLADSFNPAPKQEEAEASECCREKAPASLAAAVEEAKAKSGAPAEPVPGL